MDKEPESNAWKKRKKMAQERRATREIFEELKVIQLMLEDDTGAGQACLQELIRKLGEELGEF